MAEARQQMTDQPVGQAEVPLPRICIKFCTQCKWNLRAAYYAQELLQTFSTTIGEVSLQPTAGGVFTVSIQYQTSEAPASTNVLLWDRKSEGGFPEIKELKARVRDIIEPNRDMGHIDRSLKKSQASKTAIPREPVETAEGEKKESRRQIALVESSTGSTINLLGLQNGALASKAASAVSKECKDCT